MCKKIVVTCNFQAVVFILCESGSGYLQYHIYMYNYVQSLSDFVVDLK